MKRIFLLATLFTLLQTAGINAQNDVAYPVDLNVQIIPPYNTCIRDLAPAELNSELGRFRVTMLVRDMAHSYRPFKIRMKVRDTSGRELFSTISGEVRVQAGYPNLLSSNQLLNDFFSTHNIVSGASNLQDDCFKEGAYIFAFQVVDGDNPSLPVSRETQCFTFLEKGAPPVLISPSNRSIVQSEVGIVVPFQWQLPYVTNVRETFILEVYEVPEGINPNQVFDNVSFRVFADENIPMTVCFVEKTAGTFEVGKQYAWRVRIKDREAYINNGISEVFTFTYGTAIGTTEPPVVKVEPTLPKIIIDSVSTSSGSAIVYWQNDPANFSGYIVEVRRAGSDAAWTSTSAGYEDNSLILSNISPKIQYEVRIKGLEQQAGGPAYGIYSDTLTFQIASPEDIECGKPLPALDGSTPTAPGQEEYFTFYANGQSVEIEKITSLNGDNSFSGTGYIDFPLLKQIKIKVEFTNIQINENNELLSGTVRTVYDESTGLIMDLNRLLNKGDGGTADGPVTPPGYNKYNSKEEVPYALPIGGFAQVGSEMYVKNKAGELERVGTVLPNFKYQNNGKLDETSPTIVFSKQKESDNFAFDDNSGNYYKNVYRLQNTYEKLNDNYTVPWLAMNPGKIVTLNAKTSEPLDSVKFIIPLADGSTLLLDHADGFNVTIPSGSANTTTEIFAVAKVGDDNKVVGKLKLANYAAKTQKVNLVPVRRDKNKIDGDAIQTELNKIYGERLGIQFTVVVKDRFGEKDAGDPDDELAFLDDGLQVDGKGFWSNETQEMKYLKYLYHQTYADEIETDAAYIFVIDFANSKDVQGDMPRGKQVGYVFCNANETFADGRLIAHELGHGLYGLEHTFATGYGVPQGSTDNLMDYVEDDFLAAWQWKIIDNPGIVWNFLEGDEDAMKKNLSDAKKNIKNVLHMIRNRYQTTRPLIITCPNGVSRATNITIGGYKYDRIIIQTMRQNFYDDVDINNIDFNATTYNPLSGENNVGFMFDNKVYVLVSGNTQKEQLKKYLFDNTSNDDFVPMFSKINETELNDCINARIVNPEKIDQSETPLCGLAAITHIMATHDPDGYKNFVKDLYYYSYAYYDNRTKFCIDPHNKFAVDVWEKEAPASMPVCDYVMLTSMKSSLGTLPYSGETGNDPRGITMPSTVKMLADKFLGMNNVEDKTNLIFSGGDFSVLNQIDALYNEGYDIIMLINSEMLEGGTSSYVPDHWVVYRGHLKYNNDGKASFKVFSWGDTPEVKNIDEKSFKHTFYGYIKAKW